MDSSADSTPNNLYSSGNFCLICGNPFVVMEMDSSGETILNKQGMKRKVRVNAENAQKYFDVLQERLDIDKERAAGNGICTKCMVKIDGVVRMRKECERVTNELETMRRNVKENSMKFTSPQDDSRLTAASSSSSEKSPMNIQRKRLLTSPQIIPAMMKFQPIRPKPIIRVINESEKEKKSLKEDSTKRIRISNREESAPNNHHHEKALKNECKSVDTVTDPPPMVGIESVKLEIIE